MSDFSKFKIGSTSYDVKDANAGRSLSVSGTNLSLKNAAGTAISMVTLPGGSNDPIVIQINYSTSNTSIYPQNFNHTSLPYNTFTYDAIDATGNVYSLTIDAVMSKVLMGFPTTFKITPDSSIAATVSKSELIFTLQSIGNLSGTNDVILTFESDVDNGYVYQIILTIDKDIFTIASCYGEKIALGGGGGGGSVTTYYLYNEWGSIATFAAMTTANNCVLKDSTSTDVSISTLATAFAAGTVYIEDADGAKTRVLSLGYNSGSVRYFYMLMPSSTASAKLRSCDWSSNKYFMANVTL